MTQADASAETILYPVPDMSKHLERMSFYAAEVSAIDQLDILDGRSFKDKKRLFQRLATWPWVSDADKKALNTKWAKRDDDRSLYDGEMQNGLEAHTDIAVNCGNLRSQHAAFQGRGAVADLNVLGLLYADAVVDAGLLENAASTVIKPKYQDELKERMQRVQARASTPAHS